MVTGWAVSGLYTSCTLFGIEFGDGSVGLLWPRGRGRGEILAARLIRFPARVSLYPHAASREAPLVRLLLRADTWGAKRLSRI